MIFSFLPSVKLSRLSNTSSRLLRRELGLFRRSSTVVSSTTSTFVLLATFRDLFACFGFEGLFSTMYKHWSLILLCLFQIVIVIIIEINIVLKLNCIKLENLLLFSKLIFIQWINSTSHVFICCKHSVMYIVTLIKNFSYFIISIFMSYKFPRSTIVQYTNIPWSFKTDSSFPHLPLYLWQKLKDLSLSYKWINLSRLVWV